MYNIITIVAITIEHKINYFNLIKIITYKVLLYQNILLNYLKLIKNYFNLIKIILKHNKNSLKNMVSFDDNNDKKKVSSGYFQL